MSPSLSYLNVEQKQCMSVREKYRVNEFEKEIRREWNVNVSFRLNHFYLEVICQSVMPTIARNNILLTSFTTSINTNSFTILHYYNQKKNKCNSFFLHFLHQYKENFHVYRAAMWAHSAIQYKLNLKML